MNCQNFEDLIPLYLENKLSPKEKEVFDTHLQGCPACAQALSAFKETTELLKTVKPDELPQDYLQNLEIKIALEDLPLPELQKPKFFRPQQLFPAFGALFLLLIFGYYLRNFNKPITVPLEKIQNPPEQVAQQVKTNPPVALEQFIETKKTLEFAKATAKTDFILRGAGPKYLKKRIIKQWQDTSSGIKSKKSVVIRTQAEWQELWEAHTKNISPMPPLPDVDFTKCLVVAVFMGEQKSGGYGIQITDIQESEDNIFIEFTETVPAKGSVAAQQLTQPYHIIVVNRE
ncbi:MAG: hypothetical protein A2297_03445 [Elusimicrobia bacterium RIFOXYB2_FULL_48_7]|nr:MAG: hypothetical protein A2297_03445 [Elusimicrobia bacterium RIFOXYB2_FULL_48_7]